MHNHLSTTSFLAETVLFLALLIFFLTSFTVLSLISSKVFKNALFLGRKLFVSLVIVLLILHHAPAVTTFAYHHQSDGQSNPHPCCMPQMGKVVEPFAVTLIESSLILPNEPKPQMAFPFIYTPSHPRSPPVAF